jgi:predicted  nucleic acid-binding Zn-ribbon protein
VHQQGLKNQWIGIAGENHKDYVRKEVVHKDLDQKDLQIKEANDALKEMRKSRDESFQSAIKLQGERDKAQKEVEDLECRVKEIFEEKANLLLRDQEKKKELENQELRVQNLQKQYEDLGKLVTRHCQVFFGKSFFSYVLFWS